MTTPAPIDFHAQRVVDGRAIAVFLLLTAGFTLAVDALLLVTGGLGTTFAVVGLVVRMASPLLATVVVCRFVTRRPWLVDSGLVPAVWRGGGRRRILLWGSVGAGVALAVVVASTGVAALVGWFELDLSGDGMIARFAEEAPGATAPPAAVLALVTIIGAVVGAYTINALLALGEEAGWRGWLLRELAPAGRTRAVVTIGVVWGLWHTPLILMGYQYDGQIPAWVGIPLFVAFAVGVGVLFAWIRVRSGSVWAVGIAHGAVNAFATLPLLVLAAGATWSMPLASIVGVPGTLLFGGIAAWLLLKGRWDDSSPGTGPTFERAG